MVLHDLIARLHAAAVRADDDYVRSALHDAATEIVRLRRMLAECKTAPCVAVCHE
jgi:hypothetical protein